MTTNIFMRNDTKAMFEEVLANAQEIEFNPEWSNGTGYFNGATLEPIAPCEVKKTIDNHGRNVVLIGTEVGTIVLFQRYSEGSGPFVVVNNTPNTLIDLVPSGSMSAEAIYNAVVGVPKGISKVIKAANKAKS